MVDKLHSAALRDARMTPLLGARCLTMRSFVKSDRVTERTILEINNGSNLRLVRTKETEPSGVNTVLRNFFMAHGTDNGRLCFLQ